MAVNVVDIGQAGVGGSRGEAVPQSLSTVRARCPHFITGEGLYAQLEQDGLSYGNDFRGIVYVWFGEAEALGRIESPLAGEQLSAYAAHPALLDSCLQVLSAAVYGRRGPTQATSVVTGLRSFRQIRSLRSPLWAHVVLAGEHDATDGSVEADVHIHSDRGECVAELQGLAIRRISVDSGSTSRQGFNVSLYRTQWVRLGELVSPAHESLPDAAADVMFSYDDERCRAVAQALTRQGRRCIVLRPAQSMEECLELLRSAAGTSDRLGRVIHVADPHGGELRDGPGTLAQVECYCRPLLHLVQAIMHFGPDRLTRLCVITTGAVTVGDAPGPSYPVMATCWGMVRVLRLEVPSLDCALIDLDMERDVTEQLSAELTQGGTEDELALRGGRRFSLRLSRQPLHESQRPSFKLRADATYLITGGTGALGLHLAEELVRRGARHLLLLNRRPPSESANQIIERLIRCGASVQAVACDVADESQLQATLAALQHPVGGVIHAAGTLGDGSVVHQSWDAFRAVLLPKVIGAVNLHRQTLDYQLDFFMLCSSISALFGSAGQLNYAAANAFLDALAHHGHRNAECSLSINLGPLEAAGMAASLPAAHRAALRERGVDLLPLDTGSPICFDLLRPDLAQIIMLRSNEDLLRQYWRLARPRSRLFEGCESDRDRQHGEELPDLRDQIAKADGPQRRRMLSELITDSASRILRVSADTIDAETELTRLGMDSIMSIELSRIVRHQTGIDLPVILLLKGISVAEVVDFLTSALASASELV